MASIGWIDFSQAHRNRVGSVLELLKPEGMVDELGIGSIRDSIANQLFPGISTIQTRARYFFFIPYILHDYQRLRQKGRTSKLPAKYLEDQENSIMWDLGDVYDHKEGSGVIGITKRRGNSIARKASTIYWNGIQTYNFISTGGLSLPAYLKRSVGQNLESLISEVLEGDDSTDDADADHENQFKIKVPYDSSWKNNLTLDLTVDEAEFFKSRILTIAKGRLFSELLINGDLQEEFLSSDDFMTFAKNSSNINLKDSIRNDLVLAHDFSQLMYGVHISYNCQVHKMAYNDTSYEEMFRDWIKKLRFSMLDFQAFDPINLPSATRASTNEFIRQWWTEAKQGFPDRKRRDELIRKQESVVKGRKARIVFKKLEDVREDRWIGLALLNYRFIQASRILTDILGGLNN